MESINQISTKLNQTYWTSASNPTTVFGIFLESQEPYVNTDYPYQLVFRFYTSGSQYLADTYQLKGGIAMNGQFTYGNGTFGVLINNDTIKWSNGTLWNKIGNIPMETRGDKYSTEFVHRLNVVESERLTDQINRSYPRSNQFYGM